MDTFIAVCLGLIVLELAVMIAVFSVAMLKVREAAQAVEIAAYRVDQEVHNVGSTLRSGWLTAAKTLFSAGLTFLRRD
jgi:hypothetical protein